MKNARESYQDGIIFIRSIVQSNLKAENSCQILKGLSVGPRQFELCKARGRSSVPLLIKTPNNKVCLCCKSIVIQYGNKVFLQRLEKPKK